MMQKRSACVRGDKCLPLTFKSRLNCALFHHQALTPEEIADRAEVPYARLKSYASESQPNDHIPFRSLLRVCAVTVRWDLIDAELNTYHRGLVEYDAKPVADALNESIDVATSAGRLLEQVRELSKDGKLDAGDRAKVREFLRTVRAEVEQVDASLDEATPSQITRVK